MLHPIPVQIYVFASSLTPSFPYASGYLLTPALLLCYPLTTSNLFHSSRMAAAWLSTAPCPGTRYFREGARALLASGATFYQRAISCSAGFSFHTATFEDFISVLCWFLLPHSQYQTESPSFHSQKPDAPFSTRHP